MKTREDILRIAAKARAGLEKIYGNRLRAVYLFGSCARSQMDEDSDIDIAVVLDEVPDYFDQIELTGELGTDLTLEEGVLICFIFIPESDYQSGRYALYRAIKREGVPL